MSPDRLGLRTVGLHPFGMIPLVTDSAETSPDVQLLLARAEDEALKRGDSVWGSGEMILALLDFPPNTATSALGQLGVTKSAASAILLEVRPLESGPLIRSHEVGYFLDLADRVAYARGDSTTGLDHLLLGMLWERDSAASQICKALGVEYEDCYHALYGTSRRKD